MVDKLRLQYFNENIKYESLSLLLSTVFKSSYSYRDIINWKYKDNPFGAGIGLLYTNSLNDYVSARLLTSWQINYFGCIYNVSQPSDSATHPDYSGRGLFSKLTNKIIEDDKGKGFFNFPNSNSINIYKKLGWDITHTLKSRYCFTRTTLFLLSFFSKQQTLSIEAIQNY